MSNRTIEDVIRNVLKSDSQKNALNLVAHLRADNESEDFPISTYHENDNSTWSGFDVAGLGYVVINGLDDFPGPWTMWIGVDNLGEYAEFSIDDHIKEFAWKYISPCGDCGSDHCDKGKRTSVFGKEFENTCQANLMFVNPDADAVEKMKKIIDIRKNDIRKRGKP